MAKRKLSLLLLSLLAQPVLLALSGPAAQAADPFLLAGQDKRSFDAEDQPFQFYFWLPDAKWAPALNFVCVTHSLNPLIEPTIPVQIDEEGLLYRIDLRSMQWRAADWQRVLTEHHPYRGYSLVVSGQWFIQHVLDMGESQSAFDLIYGDSKPATAEEFLDFFEVNRGLTFATARVTDKSKVNLSGRRWVEHHPAPNGYQFAARNPASLTSAADPLNHPGGDFRQAEVEYVVGYSKTSLKTFRRGAFQFWFVSGADGKFKAVGDPKILEDTTRFKGRASVTMSGSCVQCHANGVEPIEDNLVAEVRRDMASSMTSPAAAAIALLHFGEIDRTILRAQEDFLAGIKAACGEEHDGKTITRLIDECVMDYIGRVDLERAARELWTTPQDVQDRITILSNTEGNKIPASLIGMGLGIPAPRDAFAQYFTVLYKTGG